MPDRCHPGGLLAFYAPSDSSYGRVALQCSSGIGISKWNIMSSGVHLGVVSIGIFCLFLNVFDSRAVSSGRVSRTGLRPYPRYMSSSLAPKWIEARVKKG